MRELVTANHAIGDRAELDRLWQKHGYWFFRDVLDRQSLQAMKDEYLAELRRLGVVAQDAIEPIWNGAPLDDFPPTVHALHERRVWQAFVARPPVRTFFETILDDALFWLPMDYYRVVAPNLSPDPKPYIGVHQDGMTNPGMTFVTCWMPLTDITADVGGLVVADGEHRRGYLEMKDGTLRFSDTAAVPEGSWAHAGTYRMGDVVIFQQTVPHYGLPNRSDRLRLSLDIRAVRRSTPVPVVGTVRAIDAAGVTIDSDEHGEVRLILDDETFLRALTDPNMPNPVPITRDQAPAALPPGTEVLATREEGRALILRPVMT